MRGAVRVLVVEDDATIREVMVEALEDEGFQVWSASSGCEAVALLMHEQPFDALFTNIRLPGFDGWEVARRFRAAHPMIFVIYATGYADKHDSVSGSLLFGKPYRISEITDALRHHDLG